MGNISNVGIRPSRRAGLIVFVCAFLIALASARPWAGGWNDASRLAAVEALVDYGTMSIDRSIYVDVPDAPPSPFRPGWAEVLETGTLDRIYVNGKFYSDKPPLPAVLLAGEYAGAAALTGLNARQSPGRFAWTMTLLSSGLAYALAALGVWYTAGQLRLNRRGAVALTAAFALATVSVVYARHVNSHGILLGVAVWVWAVMVRLTHAEVGQDSPARRHMLLVIFGTLLGLGYSLESAAGPLLVVCGALWAIFRLRDARAVLIVGLCALPWITTHHLLNYAVFGMIGPANAVPAHFQFPGSVFKSENMTGSWNHTSVIDFFTYSVGLWVGRRGFVLHNLPLLLAIPGAVCLLVGRRAVEHRTELVAGMAWVMAVAVVYGALSTPGSRGINCSVRWFVPLLAPMFVGLGMVLKRWPRLVTDVWILTTCGMVVVAVAWVGGPFAVTDFRVVLCGTGAALLFWGVWAVYRASRSLRPSVTAP